MGKELMELGRLKVEFAKEYLRVKHIHILDGANEHGHMELTLISKRLLTVAEVLELEDAPVKVTDADGTNVFVGICQSVGLNNEADYSELVLEAKSLSILADRKKISRTFQSTVKTLSEVANTVMAAYGIQVEVAEDIQIEQMLYQNAETDWQFLRRIANQYGAYLFTDSKSDLLRLAVGTYPFACKELGAETRKKPADSGKDILKYIQIQQNVDDQAEAYQFETEGKTSYDLTIGAGYQLESQGERVRWSQRSEIVSVGETAENRLTLAHLEGCRPDREKSAGALNQRDAIKGKIIRVQGTQIKVHFYCDAEQDEATAMWLPFENTMNNYFYSMPDEGDEVFVYYENNGKAVALGSRRANSATHGDYVDPASKMMNSTNKMLKMTPGSCELVAARGAYDQGGGNQALIQMTDAGGIVIKSTQDIHVQADKRLKLVAAKSAIPEGEITAVQAKYDAGHTQGAALYMAGGGSKPYNSGQEILKQIGSDIAVSFSGGVKAMAAEIPAFVKNVESIFGGGSGGGGGEPAPASPEEKAERPPAESLMLYGMENCSLGIGASELKLSGGAITISTPAFRQLGYNKNKHDIVAAPSLFDAALNGVQVLLDIAGCIPGLSVVANGLNAAISLARGDYCGAACSLIGCIIPGANVAGKGLKLAVAGAKVANTIAKTAKAAKAVRTVERLIMGAMGFNALMRAKDGISDLGRKIIDGTFSFNDPESLNLFFDTLQNVAIVGSAAGHRKKGREEKGGHEKAGGENKSGGHNGPDTEGRIPTKETCLKDPVNVVTGSFSLRMTDLILSDLGEDFVLTRSYESLYQNKHQHLGSRWLLSLGSRIERRQNQVRILLPDLHIETFEQQDGIYQNRRGGDRSLVLTEEKHGYRLQFIREKKTWDYNEFGRLTAITDKNGNRVKIEYTGSFISQVTLANGHTLQFTYENDKLTQIRDMLGRNIRYRYQGELLTEVTYPNDGTITYEYTDQGFIAAITDQNGQRYVANQYDGQGRVIRQTLANGAETLFFYQDQDRMTTVTQPHNGERTCYYYNRRHLVETIRYADETTEETKYDDKENILWQKDRCGHETRYTYNEESQLTAEIWPNGLIHTLEYDAAGRKIAESDTSGVDIRYRYDERGNLVEVKNRIEGERWQTVRYAYDAKGRMISYTDGSGNLTTYDYAEGQNKPQSVTTAEGDRFTYQYDAASRLMAVESVLGRKEYGYNHLDYRTLVIDALGNTWKNDYDKLGNRIKEIRPNQYHEKSHSGPGWRYIHDALDKLVATIDPLGNTVATIRDAEENIVKEIHPNTYDGPSQDGTGIENEYDSDNRKIKIRYPDGGIERLQYDAKGNIVKKILPENYNETTDDGPGYTYAYDERNRLTKITGPGGVVEKAYVYDLAGNIVKEIDAQSYLEGATDETRPGILYHYNCLGWLTEKRIPVGKTAGTLRYQTTQYKYDNAGNVIEERRLLDEQDETSASGRVLSLRFAYDRQNRLTEIKDNTGAVIEYGYNCLNQRTYEKRKINDNAYQMLRYHYDAAGRLVEIEQRADREGSGDFTARTKYQLDNTGNVIKITTPAGYCVERQYDAADRLIAEIHKDKENGIENKTEITYDKAGNIIKIQDGNGVEESYEYDLLNRETQHTGKNGGVTRTVYDKNGRITRRILPNEYQTKGKDGHGYRYTYDPQGRVITVLAPDGSILETNSYDKASRLLQRRDATQSGVDYAYDLAGRIQTIRTPGGAIQSYQYDAQGNIIGVSDGNQNKTEYKLDKWGRITEIVKADGSREYYGYDYAGNITETTDGEGNTIRYEYNLINKLKEITDPTGQTDTFHYDAQGRLKSHNDRNGNQVEYRYNIYDALTEKLERSSGLREMYEYHPDGKLKAAIAQGMRYGYRYYADGRLQEKAASGRRLLSYEYDLNGNKIRQTDVTGKTTEYIYTATDLLQEIRDERQSIVQFTHNADGTLKEALRANGMRTSYGYDIDKNISGLHIDMNGQTLAQNRYHYDGNGNRTVKEQLRGTTHYTYDGLNRLAQVQYPDYGEELFYDKAGNRSRRIVNGIEEQYTYDARNRLTSHTKQGQTAQYTYDKAGNLLSDGDKQYTYDSFNRTTRVETKDGQNQINRYDAEGLRYELEENGKLVQFIFNENREVVLEETDQDQKRLIRSFELWASKCTQEKTWYHYASDEQGSIIFVTDEAEAKNRYEYDAWGNAVVCEEQVENRYRYTGQQYDPVTQQYYLRARYYNPVIARFTQEDIYRGDGLNLYAYCANNPVVYYDPSGYACEQKDVNRQDRHETPENTSNPNQPRKPEADVPEGSGNATSEAKYVREIKTVEIDGRQITTGPYRQMQNAGLKDAHHIYQDAAVRELEGYSKYDALTVQVQGPANKVGTPHYKLTQAQNVLDGGTLKAERSIAYKSLRKGGFTVDQSKYLVREADKYFEHLGHHLDSATRWPGNRK
ncbi:RHS repeat-associated core domain-containing protein [Pelosinus fermentans]|uniref:RHS repeat-associated core domain containing protein-containing protein n=1 Tax=Pelosinus fermentans JBW45 TaxID=1192197 RepID=I8U4S9_9FIRM|nr:RHS repeat-associated core domain-containing protein [Pelosinus fermentans]AJQ29481.1 RHS repeat-associated core domain containing protein-containing protein [Pelosinus fermentans JBW45]